jgi:Protein of unknown function (DUF998)
MPAPKPATAAFTPARRPAGGGQSSGPGPGGQLRWLIVQRMPWWGVSSAAAAPVLMVAGWTIAARRQPSPVNPLAEPVSALAAVDAADRWAMSRTFLVVGACVSSPVLCCGRPARRGG